MRGERWIAEKRNATEKGRVPEWVASWGRLGGRGGAGGMWTCGLLKASGWLLSL